ncbi:MAG: hypothetical protein ACXV7J_04220 [Methylomonas sp.]
MSTFDHYASSRELIKYLLENEYNEEANALMSAMENGATGTEIFMAMRFHLVKIINSVPLKGSSKLLASRLLTELNRALE